MSSDKRIWLIVLLLFAAVATLLYWPAQGGGWYLDDKPDIAFNPAWKSLSAALAQLSEPRGLVLLSFALDRVLWGDAPGACRWVNVALHLGNSLLVVAFVRQLTDGRRWPAVLLGLLFLCHPVQTAAVSYIVQRMAVLSAFFALAALLLVDRYFLQRAVGERARLLLLPAILCAILSPLAKENTLLLPLAILLLAWYRGQGGLAPGWQAALASSLLIPLLPVIIHARRLFDPTLTLGQTSGTIFYVDLGSPFYEVLTDQALLPWRYLLAQLEVFWVYLGLIFLPLRQALDYSWPIPDAVPKPLHLGTALLLGALLYGVFRWRERFPLTFFGTAWIVIFLAVESSVLPLDPIFVHRLYLPLVGVLLILYEQLFRRREKPGILLLLIVVVIFSLLSWQRNRLWGDPVAFWQENGAVAPHARRPRVHLSVELFRAGRFREAAEVRQGDGGGTAEAWRYRLLGEARYFAGDRAAAEASFVQAERIDAAIAPRAFFAAHRALTEGRLESAAELLARAEAQEGANVFGLYLRGLLAERGGDRLQALGYYREASAMTAPQLLRSSATSFDEVYAEWAAARSKALRKELAGWQAGERARFATGGAGVEARTRWANQLLLLELDDEALAEYRSIVGLAPDLWQAHYNLGMAYDRVGERSLALASYRTGLRLAPDNPTLLLNYGIALKLDGQYRQSAAVLERLLAQSRGDGRVWIVYGTVQETLGEHATARRAYENAALLPGFRAEAAALLDHLRQSPLLERNARP